MTGTTKTSAQHARLALLAAAVWVLLWKGALGDPVLAAVDVAALAALHPLVAEHARRAARAREPVKALCLLLAHASGAVAITAISARSFPAAGLYALQAAAALAVARTSARRV